VYSSIVIATSSHELVTTSLLSLNILSYILFATSRIVFCNALSILSSTSFAKP